MLTPKPLNTQLSVFLLVHWFSSLSSKVWTSLSASDTDFLVFLAAIIGENSDKQLWLENREGFAVHSSTRPSGAKGEWRISSWWAISTHVKKYDIFFYVCCYGFSQGQKSLYNTAVYVIINVIILLGQGCVLHSRDRSVSPLHSLPPCAGGGFVHVRELVCDPPPQDFEHLPHWFQTVHPPSTRD